MNALGYLVVLLVIACLIAWFIAEFKGSRKLRITLGIVSILASFGVAWLVGSLNRLNYNAWYGEASKDLIDSLVREVEAGRAANALPALKQLQRDLRPTYESRAQYDSLVRDAVAKMQSASAK